METPVIAIGLDAADPNLIEKWMEQGYLPNLSRLRKSGTYGRLKTFEYYRAETPWTTFLTGCAPEKTGYWSMLKYCEDTYTVNKVEAYNFEEFQPFYALNPQKNIAVIDMPQTRLSDTVNGVQLLAWGAHSPQGPSCSKPESFFKEMVDKHGEHPVLNRDGANTQDVDALKRLSENLQIGIARRSAICQDVLQQDDWSLLLTVFGEAHVAGHYFWHLSQKDHPLYEQFSHHFTEDPLLQAFVSMDKAIGDILSKAPRNARTIVFSAHGMGSNVMDLPSLVFLPEFLYRLNFPGKAGLALGKMGSEPGPYITDEISKKQGWVGSLLNLKYEANPFKRFLKKVLPTKIVRRLQSYLDAPTENNIDSPFYLRQQGVPEPFQPANWYRRFWPQMKAFALPSFSEGYIRINLEGRDPQGIVKPTEYETLCDEIAEKLYELRDARTGQPMVKSIIRTRQSPLDNDPKLPDADLAVIWQEETVADCVESNDIGRIGPVPVIRTGSHRADGFILAKGEGIDQGATLEPGHSLDLAPTILSLMNSPLPHYFDGKPLIKLPVTSG
jgi:predicted AlkP superfamily phosphohydrolase/phosphomutase